MEKFAFASDAWLAELRKLIVKYAAEAGPDTNLSICEVFNKVPKSLDKHGTGTLAWHCIVENGKLVKFEETAIEVADVRTEHDYDFVLPVARKVYTPEAMAEVNAYMEQGIKDGRSRSTSRDRTKVPPNFIGMHNDLAVRTL
ncbi:MAG: hypothetical protein JSR60_05060 [Proteobacteria bacterium]|nr:hypothetical protein [Pseudomonadota bacterium]